jgi:hypothetical protein
VESQTRLSKRGCQLGQSWRRDSRNLPGAKLIVPELCATWKPLLSSPKVAFTAAEAIVISTRWRSTEVRRGKLVLRLSNCPRALYAPWLAPMIIQLRSLATVLHSAVLYTPWLACASAPPCTASPSGNPYIARLRVSSLSLSRLIAPLSDNTTCAILYTTFRK